MSRAGGPVRVGVAGCGRPGPWWVQWDVVDEHVSREPSAGRGRRYRGDETWPMSCAWQVLTAGAHRLIFLINVRHQVRGSRTDRQLR